MYVQMFSVLWLLYYYETVLVLFTHLLGFGADFLWSNMAYLAMDILYLAIW